MSGPSRAVVVPGNLDGVHRGHQALIAQARERAEHLGAEVVALTFDPHPACVVAPDRAPVPLTTLERRVQLLRGAGADRVHVVAFDHARAEEPARAFIERELVGVLHTAAIVVGSDYRFGKGREGDLRLLESESRRHDFEVVVIDAVGEGALERFSSSAIRRALSGGDVERAARALGRHHEVCGTVVTGQALARRLGFPTANLLTDAVLWPADGVYAVRVRVGGHTLRGVANLGVRPTVAAGRAFEVHLLDFGGDLVGKRLEVLFVARLRDEQRFANLEALVAQIREDVARARACLDDAA